MNGLEGIVKPLVLHLKVAFSLELLKPSLALLTLLEGGSVGVYERLMWIEGLDILKLASVCSQLPVPTNLIKVCSRRGDCNFH